MRSLAPGGETGKKANIFFSSKFEKQGGPNKGVASLGKSLAVPKKMLRYLNVEIPQQFHS